MRRPGGRLADANLVTTIAMHASRIVARLRVEMPRGQGTAQDATMEAGRGEPGRGEPGRGEPGRGRDGRTAPLPPRPAPLGERLLMDAVQRLLRRGQADGTVALVLHLSRLEPPAP